MDIVKRRREQNAETTQGVGDFGNSGKHVISGAKTSDVVQRKTSTSNILLRVVLAGTTTDDSSRLDGMLDMTA
jgi:hypothetical protein